MGEHRNRLAEIAHRAMTGRDFWPDFDHDSLAQVANIAGVPPGPPQPGGIRDLRDLLWCSIDNDDTRDMDQLSVASDEGDGRIRILVAIADVDAFVPEGSPIDVHAQHNTTSVYTAGGTFHMLPERLSTDLTSLVEGEDRLAVVVEVTVEKDGSTSSPDLHRAVVRNQARLTYDAVAAWLEGEGPAPARLAAVQGLADLVRLQDEAAQRLRRRRFERGALRLDRPSTRLVFDEGKVAAIREERQNRAQQLIEDFMIAANEATALFVDGHGLPSLRRVVHTPKRWPRIVEIARQLDEHLPDEPDSAALAAFLDRRRAAAADDFPELAVTITKLLGSGEYSVDLPGQPSPGHFGLAVNDYTHSTAPNRRFPDLVTQRQIKAVLGGASRSPYSVDELTEIASHCTEREDAAEKVERQVQKSAAALLISKRIGETFDAVVTGASEKGTWVRLFRLPVEGRLERGHQGLDVGDRLRVKLVHTDVERGFIDFEG